MKYKNNVEETDTLEIINSEYFNKKFFKDKTVLVTGATGLIGTQTVKALLTANQNFNLNIKVIALVRNLEKANSIISPSSNDKIKFIVQDVTKPINYRGKIDYIIHTANSTTSQSFVKTPVETIDTIVNGTKSLLEFAKKKSVKSFVYLSSMEVYGRVDFNKPEPLKEDEYGYVDVLKVRSSYQEGKRLAENMCASYSSEYSIPVKIARLAQTIGASTDYYNDNRVWAQFARNIVDNEDIILHTTGETIRSYIYITDAVLAIFNMLESGKNGQSYNVANSETTCSIKDLAQMLCDKYPTSNLKFELENKGYPDATKYELDTTKLYQDTGFKASTSLDKAFENLINSFNKQKV